MTVNFLDSFLILLLITLGISWIFSRFKLPLVVAYILVGIIVGPYLCGWIQINSSTKEAAELGIVLLLFTIGLEFSLNRLFSMSRIVFGYGGLQVGLSIIITVSVGLLIGLTWVESIVVSGVVATSSTAIVVKELLERKEFHTPYGRNAIGILLFQDLAVIPFLIIIPHLTGDYVLLTLIWIFIKSILAIFVILIIGRWGLRPLFQRIEETKSTEIFMLATLLVALGAAWFSQKTGLSLALGSFVAGVMLAETDFRQRLELEMRPFRDILLVLFFVSVGLQFNIYSIPRTWPWVLLLLSALIIFKLLLIAILGRIYGNSRAVSFRTALMLAQGSEFGFAILFLAGKYHIFPADYTEVVFGALLLSIVISSLLIRFGDSITRGFEERAEYYFPESKNKK